jgi:CheY-like chemotaxis protein
VDNNRAFSTILKEGLETSGAYEVTLAHTGGDALEAVVEKPFDMVIVDMGLTDVEPARLVKAIREAKPAMRLMLIPLFGQRIPDQLQGIEVKGILPKPFFVGDLPKLVGEALGIAVPAAPAPAPPEPKVEVAAQPGKSRVKEAPPPPPPAKEPPRVEEKPNPPASSAEPLARFKAKEKQIVLVLKNLNRDVRAECILVTLGAELVAFSGLLGQEQTAQLANLVAETTTAAARAAAFLGEPAGHFEQSLHEGAEYCLYSLVLRDDLVLSLALSPEVPLGTLRYRTRQIAAELLDLLS